jgi:hypothetical protein
VGIAVTAARLNTATIDAALTAARALVEHRDHLVKTRTQTGNRLHVLLTHLTPAGAPRGLTADRAADILRQIRPREPAAKTLRSPAVDLSPRSASSIAASPKPPPTSQPLLRHPGAPRPNSAASDRSTRPRRWLASAQCPVSGRRPRSLPTPAPPSPDMSAVQEISSETTLTTLMEMW